MAKSIKELIVQYEKELDKVLVSRERIRGESQSARKEVARLTEALDGALMRIQAYEAQINGQKLRLHGFEKAIARANAKVEGWKEIALELIEERKESVTNVTHENVDEHDGE